MIIDWALRRNGASLIHKIPKTPHPPHTHTHLHSHPQLVWPWWFDCLTSDVRHRKPIVFAKVCSCFKILFHSVCCQALKRVFHVNGCWLPHYEFHILSLRYLKRCRTPLTEATGGTSSVGFTILPGFVLHVCKLHTIWVRVRAVSCNIQRGAVLRGKCWP